MVTKQHNPSLRNPEHRDFCNINDPELASPAMWCNCDVAPGSVIDKAFLQRHSIDWLNDIGGCETCGPVYEVNCACGWSGDSDGYNQHMLEMADTWVGSGGGRITRDPEYD